MWNSIVYLSRNNIVRTKELSKNLLKINNWRDQFVRTKKILNKYSAVVDDYSINGIGRTKHQASLVKATVDVLNVSYHLINYLNITADELYKIGFVGYEYTKDGETKFQKPKIPRIYKKVLGQEYNILPTKAEVNYELDLAAYSIMANQARTMGNLAGAQHQLCIASEEAGELAKEISKYLRHSLTNNEAGMRDCRQTIIDELFDTLYTIRYVMIVSGIMTKDLNDFSRIYVPQIQSSEVIDKLKDRLNDNKITIDDYAKICELQVRALKESKKRTV